MLKTGLDGRASPPHLQFPGSGFQLCPPPMGPGKSTHGQASAATPAHSSLFLRERDTAALRPSCPPSQSCPAAMHGAPYGAKPRTQGLTGSAACTVWAASPQLLLLWVPASLCCLKARVRLGLLWGAVAKPLPGGPGGDVLPHTEKGVLRACGNCVQGRRPWGTAASSSPLGGGLQVSGVQVLPHGPHNPGGSRLHPHG